MVLFDETDVRLIMRARLKLAAGLPSESRIAWENRQFQPPGFSGSSPLLDKLWVREWQSIDLERKSATGIIEAQGTTRFGVYSPRGEGTEAMDALVKSIAGQFEAGQSLTNDDLRVILERTSRSDLRNAPDHDTWVLKVVTIRWRVFTRSSTPP